MVVGVTGAAGALGSAVVTRLAGRVPVVAITRRPALVADRPGVAVRAADLAVRAAGFAVRAADFDDPATLPAAFAGIDRLLLISTDTPDTARRVAQHGAAVDAAAAAGVGRIVYTSLVGADGPPELLNAAHAATETRLKAAGPAWTILRNNLYEEGLAAPGGVYATNAGEGAVAYVSRAECADAAAQALVDDGYAGRTVDVSGSRALDAVAVAARLNARALLLDDDAYRAHLGSAGLPPGLVAALITLGQAIRGGVYAVTGRHDV